MTDRQRDVLNYVIEHQQRTGKTPTLRSIRDALKLKSLAGIHRHLTALEDQGYIVRQKWQQRCIVVLKDVAA